MLMAGKLDQRVTLQTPTVSRDTSGGMTTTWADVATVYAAVRNLSGNERRATSHGGEVAEARTEITIRYRTGVHAQMRCLHRGVSYNIRHINNFMAKNESLILTCDTGLQNA